MSWFKSQASSEEPAPFVDTSEDKVRDPSGIREGRMVSNKKANRPYLAYAEFREKREAEHNAWEARKLAHEEKVAKGEASGPFTERDPTAEREINLTGILKFIVYSIILGLLVGKFLTGSYTWNQDVNPKWFRLSTYMPENSRLFSERLLAEHDGSTPGKPIYLAIDGDVYDVSKGSAYQPGGSYAIFAGIDAARAFATGCFKEHRTHDLRGLSDKDLKSIQHWKDFYANHKDYQKIGRVIHRPIDPSSPVPEDCNKAKKPAKSQTTQGPQPKPDSRVEL